jgi:tetratricopeptide (TPR) repeat protein
MNLNFSFKSSDHLRYENGRHVSGPHGGAPREVKVEPNISGSEGYTVTMFNTDGQLVVQMAPKQMKIIQQSVEKIILRGYGHDMMGSSYADYGLTIHYNDGQVSKCILHMHDRNVDIEYLQSIDDESSSEVLVSNQLLEYLHTFRMLPIDVKKAIAAETDRINNLGVDSFESNDIQGAISYYNKALSTFPLNDDALKNLIVCYRLVGDYSKMKDAEQRLACLRKIGL